MRIILTLCLILWAQILHASDPQKISEILHDYSIKCVGTEYGDVAHEVEMIDVSSDNLFELIVAGNGKIATVLFADFYCPNAGGSPWCGSSGCDLYLIVDGVSYQSRGWKPFVVIDDEQYFIMLPKSGGACGRSNASPCFSVAIWDEAEEQLNVVSK